jgi:hypothetical protein
MLICSQPFIITQLHIEIFSIFIRFIGVLFDESMFVVHILGTEGAHAIHTFNWNIKDFLFDFLILILACYLLGLFLISYLLSVNMLVYFYILLWWLFGFSAWLRIIRVIIYNLGFAWIIDKFVWASVSLRLYDLIIFVKLSLCYIVCVSLVDAI